MKIRTSFRGPLSLPILLVLGFLPLAVGCKKSKTQAAPPPPVVPVVTAQVVTKTVPVQLRAIGHVECVATVSVRARVSGEITKVWIQEGQSVQVGQTLFSIDSRPFDASLKQTEALLAKHQALLANAEADFKRYADLIKDDYVTQEQYDQTKTSVDSLRADVAADQAAIESARLQIEYCTITSPLSGRTGDLKVKAGNLIGAQSELPLVVINQMKPIYAAFTAAVQSIPQIRSQPMQTLKVQATLPEGKAGPFDGVLSFMDNAVDQSSNTILLKATFPNETEELWPGQFVDVVLTLGEEADRIVAPAMAIQTGQKGQYVFVAKEDKTAEMRPVEVDRMDENEAVIVSGLTPGEKVVINGQLRLIPGSRIEEASTSESKPEKGS